MKTTITLEIDCDIATDSYDDEGPSNIKDIIAQKIVEAIPYIYEMEECDILVNSITIKEVI